MCIIPAKQLTSDDLAILSGRTTSTREPDDQAGPEFTLQPGDAFGFGPICLSQIIQPVDPRDLASAA